MIIDLEKWLPEAKKLALTCVLSPRRGKNRGTEGLIGVETALSLILCARRTGRAGSQGDVNHGINEIRRRETSAWF